MDFGRETFDSYDGSRKTVPATTMLVTEDREIQSVTRLFLSRVRAMCVHVFSGTRVVLSAELVSTLPHTMVESDRMTIPVVHIPRLNTLRYWLSEMLCFTHIITVNVVCISNCGMSFT